MGEVPLKEAFRSLYGLALEPDGLVEGSYDFEGNIWIRKLRRNLNDWEVDEMARLLCLLDKIRPNPGRLDVWVWDLNRKWIFVLSLYIG